MTLSYIVGENQEFLRGLTASTSILKDISERPPMVSAEPSVVNKDEDDEMVRYM